MKNRFLLTAGLGVLLGAALGLGSCKKDAPASESAVGTVTLALDNVAGTKAVALDGTTYQTASGEAFSISTLEYYISNVVFTKTDGSTYAAPGVYHLVDASKPSTTSFTIGNVPVGDYAGVKFVVGVDSTTTKADPLSLTGDLNPANNMYWVWNTGHIFMKLEGTVTSAGNKALTAHIGGYRAPYNAIVTAAPAFPSGTTLLVRAGQVPLLHLSANVLSLFDGATHLPLSTFPTAMMPSAASVQVAQNYAAGMFAVKSIQAN
ncbi:MAG: MbnP family protein [Janthinobacterium lividum]